MFRIGVSGISSDELIISYLINVSHSLGGSWKITKSYEDIVSMRESLQGLDLEIPQVPDSRADNDIEDYLGKLVSMSTIESLFQWKPLWRFLDDRDVEDSRVVEIICRTTHMQVIALKAENAAFSQQLQDLSFKYEQLAQLVSSMTSSAPDSPTKREWRPSMDAVVDSQMMVKNPSATAPPGFERTPSSSQLSDLAATSKPPPSASAVGSSFSPFKETAVGQTWLSGVTPSVVPSTALGHGNNTSFGVISGHTSTTSSSPVVFSARTDSGKDLSSMDMDQEASLASGIASYGVVPEALSGSGVAAVASMAATPVTVSAPKDFKPRPVTAVDRAVDSILTLLTPYESQTLYRSSVVGLLRKQCRLSLPFCCVYEIGLHALNCNLPDDPLLLTAVFSKNHSINWCKNVLYRLNLVVEGCAAAGGYMAMKKDDPRFEGDDFKALANHMLSNAHYVEVPTGVLPVPHLKTNYEVVHKVRCVVDALECEIAPNGRSDVCLLSFFEEVAVLVGQNDLFKRSVLLIRAWWIYETATYVGSVIKHYLPDNAMLIMVTMLFNLYYEEISHPIDALHKLLVVFSKYDGFSELITIQGIVPYTMQNKQQGINVSVSGSQLTLNPPLESHLIPQSLLDKYYKLYNCTLFPEPMPFARRPAADGSTAEESSEADGSGTPTAAAASGGDETPRPAVAAGSPRRAPLNVSVERHGYNVLHPFSQNNLIPDKMTTRRVVLIHKAFQVGTANLTTLLGSGAWKDSDPAGAAVIPDIKSYFPACIGRFKDNWRPDALGNSIELISGTKEVTPLSNDALKDRLLYQMQYCNFVLEGHVLDNVIMQVTVECLEKGGMAVGEIGKLLTEQSSIANLSQKLKEGFGGLKKLLEKFKDQFVVGSNHQFNPCVVLRSNLTPEQEMQLSAGIFPSELLKVTKKQLQAQQDAQKMHLQQQGFMQQGGHRSMDDGGNQYNSGMIGGGGMQRSNRATSDYLSYNVNTSLDRRMRQQMNNSAAPGGAASQKASPRMQQQQMALQQQPMGHSQQLHQMQQVQQGQLPNYQQMSRREKQQLHQQLKMAPGQATMPQHHSQSNSLDVDWSEFSGMMNNPGGRAGQQQPQLSQAQRSQPNLSFLSIKSAHVHANSSPVAPGLGLPGLSSGGSTGVLSGTSPGNASFLGGALGGHRPNPSSGSISNWLLQDEEPEEHYQAAFQQPLTLSNPGSSQKLPMMGSSRSSFEFDLDSETSTGESVANVYAGLWGDTSSTSILTGSTFPASDLNVNANAFSSQFQMPSARGGSRS